MLLQYLAVLKVRRCAAAGEIKLEGSAVQEAAPYQMPIEQQLAHELEIGIQYVAHVLIGPPLGAPSGDHRR